MADDSGWVRLERNLPNNYKVDQLNDHDFRIWVLLMTIASSDGSLRHCDATAFALRRPPEEIKATLATLLKLRFVEERTTKSGEIILVLHHYEEHQGFVRKPAVSTAAERQKRYRERLKNNGKAPDSDALRDSDDNALHNGDVIQYTPSVQNITPPSEETPSDTPPKKTSLRSSKNPNPKPSGPKGSRIPQAWAPGEQGVLDATNLGIPYELIPNEAARFRDYWIAKPGQGGVKIDWLATWRNWCRRIAEQKGFKPRTAPLAQPPTNGSASPPPAEEPPEIKYANQWAEAAKWPDEKWIKYIEGARFGSLRGWMLPIMGPLPGEPNCIVPKHILEKYSRSIPLTNQQHQPVRYLHIVHAEQQLEDQRRRELA